MTQDDPRALKRVIDVSRETEERLAHYVALLKKWQPVQNLVSGPTLKSVWSRHIADCAQLLPLAELHSPVLRVWCDLGSGAGLPGLVIAILGKERHPDLKVHLVESNQRKIAFLRTVTRELDLSTCLHAERIEALNVSHVGQIDVISARALAPFSQLLALTDHLRAPGTVCLFHKGRDFGVEYEEAARTRTINMLEQRSLIEPESRIVIVQSAIKNSS